MSKGTILRLGAAVGAMALAGLAYASPGAADGPDGKSEGQRVEKVIIIGDHAGGEHAGGPGEVRTFTLHRMDMADCRGGNRTVRESNDNGQRTKVIICRRDGQHAGARSEGGPRVRAFAMNGGELADCAGGDRTVRESSEDGRRTKVIICRRGDGPHAGQHGGPGPEGGPRIRAFAMNGGDLADCLGGERNVTESNDNGQHSKVILCTRGGEASPAQRVERLEHALSRLTSSDQLTAEQKERVTAALREAIERLRTTP